MLCQLRIERLAWIGCGFVVFGLSAAGEAVGQIENKQQVVGSAEASPGQKLYTVHCAGCHGVTGDGRGVGALFLYPKPRDFRFGKFRLVSTTNGAPTRQDLSAVLERGMPGSSMPSWSHLSAKDRELIADEVLRLYRVGTADRYVVNLKEQQQLTDDEIKADDVQAEIKEVVDGLTTPSAASEVPSFAPADDAAVVRGKSLYVTQSCHSCHGNEGKGDGVQKMVDDEGFDTRPRDLTRGIYKGGHDVASLYRRIFYGMPGTPMPASKNLTPDQAVDLVHFLRSMSSEQQRESVVLRRTKLQVVRVDKSPVADDDEKWRTIPASSVQTFPLWWREAEPKLSIQAVHDGQVIAVRLAWNDSTRNASAVKPDEFEDQVALELYRGEAEPFLGMGTAESPIDLWQWRAGREESGSADQQSDDYPFDTPVYRELLKGEKLPDFVTARAAGNPLALRLDSAANLTAKGPGSATFRPRPSQVVSASSVWRDGHWVVVFSRPLAIDTQAGLALAPGEKCSVAFAIWDGDARDRGPQKLVSIWQDLELR